MKHAVKLANAEGLIEGIGIPWGGPWVGADGQGRDLYGQFFSAKTELCLDWFPERPLLYQHGFDASTGTSVVGRVKAWEVKADQGVWVQAQLDASSEYFDALKDLIEKGRLFFSSGSVEHLFKAAKDGEILMWPWIELSLTPSPANLFATLDQPTAEKHWASAGLPVKAFTDRVKALPTEPTPMDGPGWGAPVGSYEHLQEALSRAARLALRSDPYCCGYAWVIATFPGYCVVGVDDSDGPEFFEIEYTVGSDNLPVLGQIREVRRVFLPIEPIPADDAPMALLSAHTLRSATALLERTKDLRERRASEQRALSQPHRDRVKATRDRLAGLLGDFDALLAAPDREQSPSAEALALVAVQAARARVLAVACGLEVRP